MTPTRPMVRYHGGKWKLAPWIISHFPGHRIYLTPEELKTVLGILAPYIREWRTRPTELYPEKVGLLVRWKRGGWYEFNSLGHVLDWHRARQRFGLGQRELTWEGVVA